MKSETGKEIGRAPSAVPQQRETFQVITRTNDPKRVCEERARMWAAGPAGPAEQLQSIASCEEIVNIERDAYMATTFIYIYEYKYI